MDYGNNEQRRSKKDLKKKRLARAFKRGGRFRTMKIEGENLNKSKN